jgi:hypothetical protein
VTNSNPKMLLSECFDRIGKLTRQKQICKKLKQFKRNNMYYIGKENYLNLKPRKSNRKRKVTQVRKKVFVVNHKHHQYFNFASPTRTVETGTRQIRNFNGVSSKLFMKRFLRPWSPQVGY